VTGALERTQAVFDRGRLVASHIYRQVVEGPGGGDVLKISVVNAGVATPSSGSDRRSSGTARCRSITSWMTQPIRRISSTPILAREPMNAWLSGVDLPGALLQISLGETPPVQPDGREASSPTWIDDC